MVTLNHNNLLKSSQTNIITPKVHTTASTHFVYTAQKGPNEYCCYIILILRYDDVIRSYIIYIDRGSVLLEHRRLRSYYYDISPELLLCQ